MNAAALATARVLVARAVGYHAARGDALARGIAPGLSSVVARLIHGDRAYGAAIEAARRYREAYGACEREIVDAIDRGALDPVAPDAVDVVWSTLRSQYRAWRAAERRRLAGSDRKTEIPASQRRTVSRGPWNGVPCEPKARLTMEPTHGSPGLAPGTDRAREALARSREAVARESRTPRRGRVVEMSGYRSDAGSYHARGYRGKRRRKRRK